MNNVAMPCFHLKSFLPCSSKSALSFGGMTFLLNAAIALRSGTAFLIYCQVSIILQKTGCY